MKKNYDITIKISEITRTQIVDFLLSDDSDVKTFNCVFYIKNLIVSNLTEVNEKKGKIKIAKQIAEPIHLITTVWKPSKKTIALYIPEFLNNEPIVFLGVGTREKDYKKVLNIFETKDKFKQFYSISKMNIIFE